MGVYGLRGTIRRIGLQSNLKNFYQQPSHIGNQDLNSHNAKKIEFDSKGNKLNAEVFAEWLRRQGYDIEKTTSSHWYEASPRVYQAFPYHWLIQPPEEELLSLLRQKRAIALRYSSPVVNTVGCISYHAIYDKPDYTLDILDRRSRQNIRKGLKNCSVDAISFERLAEEAWWLENDTASRQGRQLKINKNIWRRRYKAAADLPGFEAWGALVDGRLVASLFTFQMEDCCEMISQQCHRDYLNARVNNALSFVVTRTMINRTGIKSVFYSLQSLDAPASVDQFKFRMGYSAKPVRQRVVFRPSLGPIINRASYAIVKRLSKCRPNNPLLSKAEGMLRFYLEGRSLPAAQDWPECLIDQKIELLEEMKMQGGMQNEA
jgi:hypothetical protein